MNIINNNIIFNFSCFNRILSYDLTAYVLNLPVIKNFTLNLLSQKKNRNDFRTKNK